MTYKTLRPRLQRRGFDLRRVTEDERRVGWRFCITFKGRDYAFVRSLKDAWQHCWALWYNDTDWIPGREGRPSPPELFGSCPRD